MNGQIFRARLSIFVYVLFKYRRVPKVTAPLTSGISRPERPQLSGGRYFRVAVIFG